MENRSYLIIDLKSFYASCECVMRGLDPMTTDLVVADAARGRGTICLAVSPSLKAKTVEEIHRRGGKVTATCTYAKSWLERHPQAAIKNR